MNQDIKQPQFHLIDAKGKILGRLSTQIAKILSGKNQVYYTPHIGGRDWVVVINSDKVILSGQKAKSKIYYHHSGYPGGIYDDTFEEMIKKDSRKVIHLAVKGMLPKNKLSSQALTRLRVFKTDEHDYKDKITKS